MRVAEVAYSNCDNSRKAFVLPVDGGAAGRTEMESKRITAFGRSHPLRRVAVDGDLIPPEPRLVADDGASAALALQAMAHGDARWFALNREVKLAATASGVPGRHGVGSVPMLDQAEVPRRLKSASYAGQGTAFGSVKGSGSYTGVPAGSVERSSCAFARTQNAEIVRNAESEAMRAPIPIGGGHRLLVWRSGERCRRQDRYCFD
jgi:hypothetical protein